MAGLDWSLQRQKRAATTAREDASNVVPLLTNVSNVRWGEERKSHKHPSLKSWGCGCSAARVGGVSSVAERLISLARGRYFLGLLAIKKKWGQLTVACVILQNNKKMFWEKKTTHRSSILRGFRGGSYTKVISCCRSARSWIRSSRFGAFHSSMRVALGSSSRSPQPS